MTEPVLTVQWYLAGSWTNLSRSPRAVSYRRGRNRAQDKTSSGRCTLTFGNGDRHLDPEHNAYFTLLKPGARIRLRALWNGITYTLFTGYLEKMTQHFGNAKTPKDALMVWSLVDGLSVLANANVPSAWEITARDLLPKVWYRFNEGNGPYLFDHVGSSHGVYNGNTLEFGVSSVGALGTPPDANDYAVRFPIGTYVSLPASAMPPLTNWSMTFLYSLATFPAIAQNLLFQSTYPHGLQIYHDDVGRFGVNVRNSAGTSTASARTNTDQYGDGRLTTIVAQAGQPIRIYSGDVDISANQIGTGHSIPSALAAMAVSGAEEYVMDEVMFWDRALTVPELQGMLRGYAGWTDVFYYGEGDPVDVRIDRILNYIGWSATLRDITTVAPGTLQGHLADTALGLLQAIESTIEGRLWVDPEGILKLVHHSELDSSPYADVVATFTDDGTASPYVGIGPYNLGWELVTNVVRRHNEDTVITARDTASISSYGLRDTTQVADVDSLYFNLELESDLAYYRLAHYREPVEHVEGLALLPSGNPATLYPIVLGLDLADRVAFERTPQGVGSPLTHEAIIEGMSVDIGPKKWVWQYSLDASYALDFFRFDVTLWDNPDWRFSA